MEEKNMKKETILNKLTTINAILNNNEVQDIINELKLDIIEEYKGVNKSYLQAQKAALAFLKKQAKTLKEVLAYSDIQDDRQVFTNSYVLFALKTFYTLPDVNEKKELKFPNCRPLLKDKDDNSKEVFNIKETLARLKAKDFEDINKPLATYETSKGYVITYNANYLKDICNILGTDDLEVYIFKESAPILFVDNRNDNRAYLAPVRNFK